MRKEKVKIEWDDTKDELYTYFGRCECGFSSVPLGSNYCSECGKAVLNKSKTDNNKLKVIIST